MYITCVENSTKIRIGSPWDFGHSMLSTLGLYLKSINVPCIESKYSQVISPEKVQLLQRKEFMTDK